MRRHMVVEDNVENIFESAVYYCKNSNEFGQCMSTFNEKGLGYATKTLAGAGLLPKEYASLEHGPIEEDQWKHLTAIASGDPEAIANHLFDGVADWCTRHRDDTLECLEDHSPDNFDVVVDGNFLPDIPYDVATVVMENISEENWNKAEKKYGELWRRAHREAKKLYK